MLHEFPLVCENLATRVTQVCLVLDELFFSVCLTSVVTHQGKPLVKDGIALPHVLGLQGPGSARKSMCLHFMSKCRWHTVRALLLEDRSQDLRVSLGDGRKLLLVGGNFVGVMD